MLIQGEHSIVQTKSETQSQTEWRRDKCAARVKKLFVVWKRALKWSKVSGQPFKIKSAESKKTALAAVSSDLKKVSAQGKQRWKFVGFNLGLVLAKFVCFVIRQ